MKHIFWFQHRYYPVRVNKGRTITAVLYRCNCGREMRKTIEGQWTLDQVKEQLLDKIKDRL